MPVSIPNHDESLFGDSAFSACARLHAMFQQLNDQRTLLRITDIKTLPGGGRLLDNPSIDANRRPHRMSPLSLILGRFNFQVSDHCIAGHGQQILFAASVQFPAKFYRTP